MSYKKYRIWTQYFKQSIENSNISFEKLVQRINELYFDYITNDYKFVKNIDEEKKKLKIIAKKYLKFRKPIKILDIGTGTGFVPLTIGKYFKKNDIFYCSDISEGMLDMAKKNVEKSNLNCQFKFIKIKNQIPYKLPFKDNYIDVIAMNSLLHHINDTRAFLQEMDRILKIDGIIIIGHEPNRYFYENKFLWINYLIFMNIMSPGRLIGKIFKKIFKHHKQTSEVNEKIDIIMRKINQILLNENLIKEPLTSHQISLIVDIKATNGFKPDLVFKNYEILNLETYNHLFWVSTNSYNKYFVKIYEKILRRIFPIDGSTFNIVLKKRNKTNILTITEPSAD